MSPGCNYGRECSYPDCRDESEIVVLSSHSCCCTGWPGVEDVPPVYGQLFRVWIRHATAVACARPPACLRPCILIASLAATRGHSVIFSRDALKGCLLPKWPSHSLFCGMLLVLQPPPRLLETRLSCGALLPQLRPQPLNVAHPARSHCGRAGQDTVSSGQWSMLAQIAHF